MHAHNVMSLCKLKLEQYGEVLKDALPVNLIPTHPAYQALGGIKEVNINQLALANDKSWYLCLSKIYIRAVLRFDTLK